MPPRRFRAWLCLIFALGLLARLAGIVQPLWGSSLRDAGAGVNRQLATNLIERHGFHFRDWDHFGPSSIQTPPYPTLLAALFWMFGIGHPNAYLAALTINALGGAACAVIVALLARRVTASQRAAVAAGILAALWPSQMFAGSFAQPMVLAGLMVALSCLLWRRATERTSLGAWIGFSAAAALAGMLEPRLLPAAVAALASIAFIRNWPVDIRARNAAVMLAVWALAWLPWLARNHAVHGHILITTNFWRSVWAGANDNATGSDRLPLTPVRSAYAASAEYEPDNSARIPMMQIDALPAERRAQLARQPEAVREARFRDWAIRWIREDPAGWLGGGGTRLAKAVFIDWDHPMSRHVAAWLPRGVLGTLTLIAVVLALRGTISAGPELLVAFTLFAIQATSVATAKAALSAEPVQLAASVGAAMALARALSRTWISAATSASGAPAPGASASGPSGPGAAAPGARATGARPRGAGSGIA